MGNSILDGVIGANLNEIGNLLVLLKIPLVFILSVSIFYSFMLLLKVRILRDTISLENEDKVRILVYINLLISLVVGVLGIIIIVLG